MDYAAMEAVAHLLEQAASSPSLVSGSSSFVSSGWSRLVGWLSDDESCVRARAIRALDCALLGFPAATSAPHMKPMRRRLAQVLCDATADDEAAPNRCEAAVQLGRLCRLLHAPEDSAWLIPLAYPVLRAHLSQSLPPACARAFDADLQRTTSGDRSAGAPSSSTSAGTFGGSPFSSRGLSFGLDRDPSVSVGAALASALEGFGSVFDSRLGREPSESSRIDSLFLSLLTLPDLDTFARAAALEALATQLRPTHRTRRRVFALLPAVKRLMSPGVDGPGSVPAPAHGSTAFNIGTRSDRLHPHLLRALSQFVATWYCVPPDRLLRRFPVGADTGAMLRGYALRQIARLTAPATRDDLTISTTTSSSAFRAPRSRHRKRTSAMSRSSSAGGEESLSHGPAASSSTPASSTTLSSDSYGLLDSDQLGWATQRGVDLLLQDLAKWKTRRALMATEAATAGTDDKPKTSSASTARGARPPPRKAVDTVTGWNHAANASMSLSGDEGLVSDLLATWGDLTFHLRSDALVGGGAGGSTSAHVTPSVPATPRSPFSAGPTPLSSQWSTGGGGRHLGSPSPSPTTGGVAPSTSALLLASRASRARRSHTLEFDARTSFRVLRLANRSSRHAHDFFLQASPPWAFQVEPAWGTLEPGASKDVRVRFLHTPLDAPETRVTGYLRVRSAHGFALERVGLLGISGASLRVMHANGAPPDDTDHGLVNYNADAATSSATLSSSTALTTTSSFPRVTLSSGGSSSSASSSVIDFGICFIGLTAVRHVYVQNLSSVSTQATLCYLGPDADATGADKKSGTSSDANTDHGGDSPAFRVIPSLMHLRPREARRVAVVFYPRSLAAVRDARLVVMGPGEERYSFRLQGRGGAPLEILPRDSPLDLGTIDALPPHTQPRELARELKIRAHINAAATAAAGGANSPGVNASLGGSVTDASGTSLVGVHTAYLTLVNRNPSRPLPVSFRYAGQRRGMLSDGLNGTSLATISTGVDEDDGLSYSRLDEFDSLHLRDLVLAPASTTRVPVTLVALKAGPFSARVWINTPDTPTDALSILVTAHIGPLINVGACGVVNLAPSAVNTATHLVLPVTNLSRMQLRDVEVRGLTRTPFYFAVARMPKPNSTKPAAPLGSAEEKSNEAPSDGSSQSRAAPNMPPEELVEYFDPPTAATCALPRAGRDFLPAPLSLFDLRTSRLARRGEFGHDVASSSSSSSSTFSLASHETVLLHIWFVTHVPGFYCVSFDVRVGAPAQHAYGPVDLKAVCLARSMTPAAPPSDFGAAPARNTTNESTETASEDDDDEAENASTNASLLRDALESLAESSVQFRGDASSVSASPFKRFSVLQGSKAVLGGLLATTSKTSSLNAGAAGVSVARSYASEFVAVPSERFDAEIATYVVPRVEGSGAEARADESDQGLTIDDDARSPSVGGVDYVLYKLPRASAFASQVLRLPPRLWLWRRKTLLLMLSNLSLQRQQFRVILTFPFASAFCDAIDAAEVQSSEGGVDGGISVPSDAGPAGPASVDGLKTAKIDVALLVSEEWSGQRAAVDAAAERARVQAAAALQAETEAEQRRAQRRASGRSRTNFPSLGSRASLQARLMLEAPAAETSLASSGARRFRSHMVSTGFLAVVDSSSHISVCVLRGLLGDLVTCSAEDDGAAEIFTNTGNVNELDQEDERPLLVFTATTPSTAASAGRADSTVAGAQPVTRYIRLRNHTDLNISFGFQFGGPEAPEVLSTTTSTFAPGGAFSMRRPASTILAAYETRRIAIQFAPTRPGRFRAHLRVFYRNPYQASDRLVCRAARLLGDYVLPDVLEVGAGGEGSLVSLNTIFNDAALSTASTTHTTFLDCGTVIVADSTTKAPTAVAVANTSSAPSSARPLTLHSNASQSMAVSGLGAAPFFVSRGNEDPPSDAVGGWGVDTRVASDEGGVDGDDPNSLSLPGASSRRGVWGERRAARLRQKSGNSYVLREETVGSGWGSGSGSGPSSTAMALTSSPSRSALLLPAPVTQLVTALSAAQFRITFRPTGLDLVSGSGVGGGGSVEGLFAAQVFVRFLHFFARVDCFGRAGRLELASSWGPPTIALERTPTILLTTDQRQASGGPDTDNSLAPPSTRRLGLAPRHHRELTMPSFAGGGLTDSPRHQRHASMAVSRSPSSVHGGAAVVTPPTAPIDLGLSPLRRLLRKSFTLTNSGSMPLHIARITVVHGGGCAAAGSPATGVFLSPAAATIASPATAASNPATGSSPSSLTARQGGLTWSFAHTTVVRTAARSAEGVESTARVHTVATSSGGGAALHAHARHPLSATQLRANALGNAWRARRANTLARNGGEATNVVSMPSPTPRPTDGFAVEDLDAPCVDWDEVDFQLETDFLADEVERAAGAHDTNVPFRVPALHGARRQQAADSKGTTSSAAGDSDDFDDEWLESSASSSAVDFPLVLPAGHALPLTLWYFKDRPGTFLHELQISCIDPGAAAAASAAATAAAAAQAASAAADQARGRSSLTLRGSLTSGFGTGTISVTGADGVRRPPAIATSSSAAIASARAAAEAELLRAGARGDFSGWDADRLRRLECKTFAFLLRVVAQEPLRFDRAPNTSSLAIDFGTVRMRAQAQGLEFPSGSSSTELVLGAPVSDAASRTRTLTFVNPGSTVLHWRLVKLRVDLARIRPDRRLREVAANNRARLREAEERDGDDDEEDDDVNASSDSDSESDSDFISESRLHEGAFQFAPPLGVLAPRARQEVRVTFAPSVAHLRYDWTLALRTSEMAHAVDSLAERDEQQEAPGDPTICRLVGIAGCSRIIARLVDDATGLERTLPLATATPAASPNGATLVDVAAPSSAASAFELAFGCISLGTSRTKRLRLRNSGELACEFELANTGLTKRFHVVPTRGRVEGGGRGFLDLLVSFRPEKASFSSAAVALRWAARDDEDGPEATSHGHGGDEPEPFTETLRLMLTGKGGLSALRVDAPQVDFGTVTVHQDHVAVLRVRNEGAAEGEAVLQIQHPAVRMRDPSQALFVPPGGHIDVPLVFHPTTIDPLDGELIVRTAAGAGGVLGGGGAASGAAASFRQSVRLCGIVGVPHLIAEPRGVLDRLDFGTCLTGTTRTFPLSLANRGDVDVKFEAVFLRLRATPPVTTHDENNEDDTARAKLRKGRSRRGTSLTDGVMLGGSVPDFIEEYPSLTRVRHGPDGTTHESSSETELASFFSGSGVGGGSDELPRETTRANDVFFEDHMDALEEFVPTALSIYPANGRIAAGGRLELTLTFAPTLLLELVDCALLIRSTHGVAHTAAEARANRAASGFEPLYARVRGLAGEQRLMIESASRRIDFGLVRVGGTVCRELILANPGNVRVDFHLGPMLDEAEETDEEDSPNALSPRSSSRPPLDYSSRRKSWLSSLNARGFDFVYTGEVLPGSSTRVLILFTPRAPARRVAQRVRIVSNARLDSIDLVGAGAQSALTLLRRSPLAAAIAADEAKSEGEGDSAAPTPAPEDIVDTIDFGLLPIIPPTRNGPSTAGSSSSSLSVAPASAYRRVYWLHNSGGLAARFLVSRHDLPREVTVRPMEAVVPPYQAIPIAIRFNPETIGRLVDFRLKLLGTADDANASRRKTSDEEKAVTDAAASAAGAAESLSVRVTGSGGFGILGVVFLNDSDAAWRGLDFGVVSVHRRHQVERCFSLVNSGTVPLRARVDVDHAAYAVGVAGPVARLSAQLAGTSGPTRGQPSPVVDEAAMHNEIRYNSRRHRYHVARTHHAPITRHARASRGARRTPGSPPAEKKEGVVMATSTTESSSRSRRGSSSTADAAYMTDAANRAEDGAANGTDSTGALVPSGTLSTSSSSSSGVMAPNSSVDATTFTASLSGSRSFEMVLQPGTYAPIFVRLLVGAERAYVSTVTVASEHAFVSVPVRAEGGVVRLSHTGTLDFGTVGCVHRYTRTVVLRNTGTVATRARLFWSMRGNGQDASGGSALALSGARPFVNPFLASSDEEFSEDDPEADVDLDDPPSRQEAADDGEEAEDAASRALKRAHERAQRVKRREQRRAQRAAAATAAVSAPLIEVPLHAVDTHQSVIRLYGSDDAPPVRRNIARLWWQRVVKFIRVLLRAHRMMHPARARRLFATHPSTHQSSTLAGSDGTPDAGHGRNKVKKQTTPKKEEAAAPPQPPASVPPKGLEDTLSSVSAATPVTPAPFSSAQAALEEESRLALYVQHIKRALVRVAELDPALREATGGSPLDQASAEEGAPLAAGPGQIESTPSVPTASASTTVDTDVGLPPSHPMYASALLLSQKGAAVESRMKALVSQAHHRFAEGENPPLTELIAAGQRLHLRMARHRLPRIGDPGDGAVDMTSADSADRVSQVRLAPSTVLLAKEARVEVTVDINVPQAGAFNATLVVECDLAGVERYEIPLRALAAQVHFAFDDHSPLDFGRLPLGETELRTRTLTNLGEIPVRFHVEHENPGLTVSPMEGIVAPGRRKPFAFTFRPVDETVQQMPIRILTNCTPTLHLGMFGAGGVPKLHMASFDRLDFGRCMVGKSVTRVLRMTNTGTANLPLLGATLAESPVFHKGLRAHAERDAADHQRGPRTTTRAKNDDKNKPDGVQRRRSRGHTVVGTAGGVLPLGGGGAEDTFGLNQASIAGAAAPGTRGHRSLYIPAGTSSEGGLLSALGQTTAEGDAEAYASDDGLGARVDVDDLLAHFGHHDWPDFGGSGSRVHIRPGESLDLPIQFRPPKEDLFHGRVVLETLAQAYSIELVGTGREALLVYDQKVIEFQDCLVGNTYTREFSLMNVGEVKYPVKIILQDRNTPGQKEENAADETSDEDQDRPESCGVPLPAGLTQADGAASPLLVPRRAVGRISSLLSRAGRGLSSADGVANLDLKVFPSEVVLGAFEKAIVTVTFTPTRALAAATARIVLDSVYSRNVIAVHLVAGTAAIELSTTAIDFGLVEQGHKVSAMLSLRNPGTLPLAFRIKPPSLKPFHALPFTFSKWTGVIPAGGEADVMCRAHLLDLGSFCEELCIETERVGQRYFFTVSGECARSHVDPSKFRQVNYGYCLVGEPVSQVVAIQNEGGFPLEFDMKFNYPLTVTPKSGRIAGRQTQTFQVAWVPTGGYDMRSVVHVDTNIGVFDIAVRGVGAYPRFVLRDAYIDFGVCAFHHTYRREFGIVNKGRVAIAWSIPAVDAGFAVEPDSGLLGAGEECAVSVAFTATRSGVYHGNFIVESKGRYREVNVVGIGGVLSLDYPETIDLESAPAGQWSRTPLTIQNTGDVTLHLNFRLDRDSIDAEPNTDDEEDEPVNVDDDDFRPSLEHRTPGAHVELIEDEDAQAHATDAKVAGVNQPSASSSSALVPAKATSSSSRSSRRRSSGGASHQFAVKVLPRTLVVPPKSVAVVIVRTFVPAAARDAFAFRLLMEAIEATLPIHFRGTPTTVRISNYARALLIAERDTFLALARTPHPLQRDYAADHLPVIDPADGDEHAPLVPMLSSISPDLRRQQLLLIQSVSRALSAAPAAERRRNRVVVQRRHSLDDRRSTDDRPADEASVTADDFDSDVVACLQCLDSIISAVSVASEHRALLLHQDELAVEPVPLGVADAADLVSRASESLVPMSVLAFPTGPGSQSLLLASRTGDSGTGRSRAALARKKAEAAADAEAAVQVALEQRSDAGTPSLEYLESLRAVAEDSSSLAGTDATSLEDLSGAAADGVLLSVLGATHFVASAPPLSVGINDVADTVRRCEPRLAHLTHAPLLRYIEPTMNVAYLQILPNLLANPPEFID